MFIIKKGVSRWTNVYLKMNKMAQVVWYVIWMIRSLKYHRCFSNTLGHMEIYLITFGLLGVDIFSHYNYCLSANLVQIDLIFPKLFLFLSFNSNAATTTFSSQIKMCF